MTGTLYLVGTPIGNLEDVTDRARRTLQSVSLVAAEDTRRTGRLLQSMGISARMLSFFEGNEAERTEELAALLEAGSDVAVVSDAGMPGLSDPGYRLVVECVSRGIPVDVVPGPSAAVAALVVSGLPTDRFVFEGFLPRSGRGRSDRLAALAGEPRTIVLFESPRRLGRTLDDLLRAVGDRRVAVARELTKLHQEIMRGPLSDLAAELAGRDVKGEVVVVLEGAPGGAGGDLEEATRVAERLVEAGERKRGAAGRASRQTGVPSGLIYDELVRRSLGGGASSGRKA